MPPLVFKPLGRDNVIVNPFTVSKNQALTFTSGGNAASNSFSIASAIDFSDPNSFSPNTAVTNSDGTYQSLLFKSVEHIFYTSGALSGSADFAAGGSGIRDFPLSGSVYVVNIPQPKFGEGIRPGTFEMTDPNASSTASVTLVDDGQGKLVISGTSIVMGSIFYDLGVAVVKRQWSPLLLSGLVAWYDSRWISGLSDGAGVATFADMVSGGTNNLTSSLGQYPTYSVSVPYANNMPGLFFTGSVGGPAKMTAGAVVWPDPPYTVIMVMTPNQTTTADERIVEKTTYTIRNVANIFQLQISGSSGVAFNVNALGINTSSCEVVAETAAFVTTLTRNGQAWGGATGSAAIGTPRNLILGSTNFISAEFRGWFHALGFVNRAITADEQLKIAQWSHAVWGTPV